MDDDTKPNPTEYWKARFELDEIPEYNPSFTTEEHIRILHLRSKELEKVVKRLDTTIMVLVCVIIIIFFVIMFLHFY